MGAHEGKPAEDEEFVLPEMTPAQSDGAAKPGQHEKATPKK